jgi:hypothetical protein
MTEEEVNVKFLEMNKEIFTKKLNIDLDKCYNNLNAIFNNVINAFQKDMELRIYELSFDSESILTREEIEIKTKEYFNTLKEYIATEINKNESLLIDTINNQDLNNYVNIITMCGNNLYNGISELYLKQIKLLLNDLGNKLDVYSKARLEKIINEIIYDHFMERCKMTIDSIHNILINNVHSNELYLDNMNKSTIKSH